MSKKLNTLREDRNRIVTEARGILDKAEAEKRDLSAEENGKYEELMTEQSKRADAISREERQVEAERTLAEQQIEQRKERDEGTGGALEGVASPEYRSAFTKLLAYGRDGMNVDEMRSLSAGAGTEGGYLVMPQQMVSGLIKAMDNEVFIRRKATVYSLPNAASLGAASLSTDIDDADWTSELATGNEDNALAFGKRELNPKPLAKRVKISNKLLQVAPGTEGIVMSRLAYKFGVSQEKGFMTGTGANQPLGVFTASASGISTGRDIATGNTTTSFTYDGLIEAKYSLKAQYMKTAEWIFHRDAVKMLAKLKNGEGDYIWDSEKDTLLQRPITMSEYAPNTFTTGLYVGIFGDFSHYWIADALNIQLQRLVELYALTNQTGFIGRMESDGMPVLEEAFSRVKLA
jgi:HK97 family phage major capsid protein